MDATSCRESQSATSALATASSAYHGTAVDAAFMVATCLSRTTSSGRGNFSLRGNYIFGGNDAFDYNTFTGTATTANAARAITGFSDEEDIAEDQPMPAQPLLPARRPRADSIADPGVAVEAPADVVPVAPPAEVPVQTGLPVPAAEVPVQGAVAPASKKARQYDLPPQQPLQPMPQLQPQLPTSSSSPAALDDSTLPEPEAKKHKKQEEDDEELAMDTSRPLQPTDPPVLPLSEHQTPVAADLEASRSRSRTHSEVSEAPTILYQDQPHDPPRQIGQEEASLPEPPPAPPDPPSRTSSVAPTEFYSDIAKAHGRVHAQLGDEQDFLFWQNMGKHNLVLWLDYTEEVTTYHTLDMTMWGAVRYRRTFSSDDCNMVQSIAIDHKYSPSAYRTTVPIHSGKGFFTEFWHDPQALDTAHWLCDSFADFIAPVSFVLLSYMDEMALNATRKNRARKEATMKELKVYARMFIEAKSAEIKSWFDNDVFDLVDIRATGHRSSRAPGCTFHSSGQWSVVCLYTLVLQACLPHQDAGPSYAFKAR